MALPVLLQKLFKDNGYGSELNDSIVSKEISVQDWDSSHNYAANALVKTVSGIFRSVQASGPGTSAGARNPVQDDGAYWINETDVVHKSGNEDITGIKTFRENYNTDTYDATEVVLCVPNLDLGNDSSLPTRVRYASIQFSDDRGFEAANSGVAVIDVTPPTQSRNYFDFNIRMREIGNYAGGTYTGEPTIRLKSFPDGSGYVDINKLMVHAGEPVQAFRCQNAPSKGTLPDGKVYCHICFMDNSEGSNWVSANHKYGEVLQEITSSGNSALGLVAYKNVAGSTDSVKVSLLHVTDGSSVFQSSKNGETRLGSGGLRWGQIYSSSASISTSDARLKTEPDPVPDEVLDAWGDVGFVQFQMLDSVERKGAEQARLHNGLIAQRIDAAFKSRGLDASRYGLFCYDAWDAEEEERDEQGNVMQEAREAGDCYSLRYEEALCMEAAYQRRRADRAEARIASLEARLAALEAKLNG